MVLYQTCGAVFCPNLLPLLMLLLQDHSTVEGVVAGLHHIVSIKATAIPLTIVVEDVHWLKGLTTLVWRLLLSWRVQCKWWIYRILICRCICRTLGVNGLILRIICLMHQANVSQRRQIISRILRLSLTLQILIIVVRPMLLWINLATFATWCFLQSITVQLLDDRLLLVLLVETTRYIWLASLIEGLWVNITWVDIWCLR